MSVLAVLGSVSVFLLRLALTARSTGRTVDLLRFSEIPQCAGKLDDVRRLGLVEIERFSSKFFRHN
jgi:hypothetical protein